MNLRGTSGILRGIFIPTAIMYSRASDRAALSYMEELWLLCMNVLPDHSSTTVPADIACLGLHQDAGKLSK